MTRFRTRKVGLLLAYLAYYRDHAHSREHLCELLWPEIDPRGGRVNLRNVLRLLRQDLESAGVPTGSVVCSDRGEVCLSPDTVKTDVSEFEAALQSARQAGDGTERTEHLAQAVSRTRESCCQATTAIGCFRSGHGWRSGTLRRSANC